MLHKQLPFAGCHIALEGYPEDEAQHMRDIAADNGEFDSFAFLSYSPPWPQVQRMESWVTQV